MRFAATPLDGAYEIDLVPFEDERGFFARSYCTDAFAERGLDPCNAQSNVSFNHVAGTLRGMHYQLAPRAEAKLVRCTAGKILDVIVDLREESPTRGRWHAVELTAANRRALYIPPGFAHGFQTLVDGAEVFYQISTPYVPGFGQGLHYASPSVGIDWPLPVSCVNPRDAGLPTFAETFE